MEIMIMVCPSCQAPLKIPKEIEHLSCGYCGSSLIVKRTPEFATLNLAEEVSQTIQQVGSETQNTIREGTSVTQSELRRLQIGQELSSLKLQLSTAQSEMRLLNRGKKNRKIRKDLRNLRRQERSIKSRVGSLEHALRHSVATKGDVRKEKDK